MHPSKGIASVRWLPAAENLARVRQSGSCSTYQSRGGNGEGRFRASHFADLTAWMQNVAGRIFFLSLPPASCQVSVQGSNIAPN